MSYPPPTPRPEHPKRPHHVPHHAPAATPVTKSVIVAVLAGLTAFLATVHGRTDLDTMKVLDWVIVLVASLVAGLTVYAIPEKPKDVP